MTFYRLLKPNWGKKTFHDGEANPDFKEPIDGPDTVEGCLSEDDLIELNKMGYNAYWFPNHPSTDVYANGTKYLSGKLIDTFNYVFVDMDLKDGVYSSTEEFFEKLKQFPIMPTFTVSSGHGVHAYWKINNLTRESYIFTQMALLKYLQTDDSVWTVLQLMRVPESLNTKEHGNFKFAKIEESVSCGKSYNIEEFPSFIYDLLSDNNTKKIENHLARLDGKIEFKLDPAINIDELPPAFLDIMFENDAIYQLFNNPKAFYGDRSKADMKLANLLLKNNISKKDALVVIANTEKSREKGSSRMQYAELTVSKVYTEYKEPIQTKQKFLSVKERIDTGFVDIPQDLVRGPLYFDCLKSGWAKTKVLGLIGGSGIGKTAVTLESFKHMINNNYHENDDIFAFFSLEMPEREIIDRWITLVGAESPLASRLYVIGNETDGGDPRNLGLQEIYEICEDLKEQTGKQIASLAIDHFGILSLHIDTRKKHTFGIESEQGTGHGPIRTMSMKNAASQIKVLAKMVNAFVILLAQTTKSKGVGHAPLGKEAAYGVSQFENIADFVLTLWQPLQPLQEKTDLRILAWQYAKIRSQHKDDAIKINSYKILTFDMDSGALRTPTEAEFKEFSELLPQVFEQMKNREKQVETTYSRAISQEDVDIIKKRLGYLS